MSTPYPSDPVTTRSSSSVGEASVGELLSQLAGDFSTLMHQEVELAKAEMKGEVGKARKGAAMLGGAGYAGLLVGVFASLTGMFLLDLAMPLWAAALIVTAVWAIVGYALLQSGRKQLKTVHPTPTQTVETLKETFDDNA